MVGLSHVLQHLVPRQGTFPTASDPSSPAPLPQPASVAGTFLSFSCEKTLALALETHLAVLRDRSCCIGGPSAVLGVKPGWSRKMASVVSGPKKSLLFSDHSQPC